MLRSLRINWCSSPELAFVMWSRPDWSQTPFATTSSGQTKAEVTREIKRSSTLKLCRQRL
eukprot:1618870-Amphidinium_carterae.1